ncbi:Aromatic-ring hydroxylase-like protein [Artemisia annua]|uniref:Aromatic-ring hydroxylase-like protein n=1 Tax=Artemisia annua TaxID=35608 RepID=A0A2U1NLY4_ARTAN|nr:Aromatic-ring hydroxylase-like protein [Artemisia annua]
MLAISSSLLSLHRRTTNTLLTRYAFSIPARTRNTTKSVSLTTLCAGSDIRKEEVVIVGAGIAGLSCAVCLHRLGVRSLVLEQGESLRTGGTSLTLSKNGWTVLDAMGVADELRPQYLEIEGVFSITKTIFDAYGNSTELRAVERKTLLETLAKQLPVDSVTFSSKLAKIKKHEDGETLLELVNGTRISSKVVIGCDGIHSPVAKWMGYSEAKYVGYCAFRGLGDFPNGQPYESRVNYMYGRHGIRVGYVPVSTTKVYWFIIFNSPEPGSKITDPSVLKRQAKELVKKFPSELQNLIDATPDDTIIRNPLADRWLWPGLSPPASLGGTVLVGDAWHPMTPNAGQGACTALEDAIVLVQKLAPSLKAGPEAIEDAYKSYQNERWPRIFPMTVRANFAGAILQSENPLVCAVRDNVLVPKLLKLGPMLEHTGNFKCEPLQQTKFINSIRQYVLYAFGFYMVSKSRGGQNPVRQKTGTGSKPGPVHGQSQRTGSGSNPVRFFSDPAYKIPGPVAPVPESPDSIGTGPDLAGTGVDRIQFRILFRFWFRNRLAWPPLIKSHESLYEFACSHMIVVDYLVLAI